MLGPVCLRSCHSRQTFWSLHRRVPTKPYGRAATASAKLRKRAIHITHNLTRGMPYSSMLLHVNVDSLATRREDLSRRFFCDIMDPASCLHSLLTPPRSTAITSRLRSSQILPRVHTRSKRYCSFIQYGLNHYQ